MLALGAGNAVATTTGSSNRMARALTVAGTALGVASTVVHVARLAHAETSASGEGDAEPVRFVVDAPASCPASPSMIERVRSHSPRVREARAGEAARELSVAVRVRERGFEALLRLVDGDDVLEREVPGRSCGEVLSAVALIAALAIDARPSDGGAGPDGVAPDARSPSPLARWGRVESEADAASASAEGTRRIAPGLGSSLAVRGMGEATLGASFWVEGTRATRAAPSFRLRFTRSQSFTSEVVGRRASFVLTTAALEGCVTALRAGRLSLRPCLAVEGGALEAASAAFGAAHDEVRPWLSVGAFAQGRLGLVGPLFLEAGFGFAVPVVRDDFYFRPRAVVYRAPPLVLGGGAGVGVLFP